MAHGSGLHELATGVGQWGRLHVRCSDGVLHVPVQVVDFRTCYGRLDYMVECLDTVRGAGRAWVSADRVSVQGPIAGRAGASDVE